MTKKGSACSQCGRKVISSRGPSEEFDVKNFGTTEKPEIKIICKGCSDKLKRAYGAQV